MSFYRGWAIVAIAMIVYMLVVGSTYAAFGLFVVPVSASLGLSRADMNTALILLNVGTAAMAPLVGRLLDRLPARGVMAASAVLFGASFVMLGLSRSLAFSAAVMAVPLAIGVLGGGTLTAPTIVARWFTVQRGRALVLAAIGASLGGLLAVPAISLAIVALGWRAALLGMGAVTGVVLLLLAALPIERPGPRDREPGSGGAVAAAPVIGAPLRIGTILAMPQFWTIGIGTSVTLGLCQAVYVSLAPLAIAQGLTTVQATELVSLTAASSILGSVVVAAIADRIGRVALLAGLFGLCAVIDGLVFASHGFAMLAVCALLNGVAAAALAPLYAALLAERFGMASFGTVRGLLTPLVAVAGAVAVRGAGEVFDRTGDYALLALLFPVCQAAAAVLMLATGLTRRVGDAGPRATGGKAAPGRRWSRFSRGIE